MERQPDLVRLSMATMRRRRSHLLEHRRRNQPNLPHPDRRPGLPATRTGDSPKSEGLRHSHFRNHLDRGTSRDDHKPPPDLDHPPSPVHRLNGLRDLPHLRRLVQEPLHRRDRLPAGQAPIHPPLRNPRTAKTLRRLHTTLAPGRPLPRPRPLHAHASRNRQIRPHQPARPTHLHARVTDRTKGSRGQTPRLPISWPYRVRPIPHGGCPRSHWSSAESLPMNREPHVRDPGEFQTPSSGFVGTATRPFYAGFRDGHPAKWEANYASFSWIRGSAIGTQRRA